jgi:two-component system sensor histidine kinase AtoS
MKVKLIILLSMSILLAVVGGTYLLATSERRMAEFDHLLMMHEVEILRGQLLLDIRTVEAALYSQSSRHPEGLEAIIGHVKKMEATMKSCFECHHEDSVNARLYDLDDQISDFSHALSRILTLRGNPKRLADEAEMAHIIADSLVSKVNTMIILTGTKLNEITEASMREVARTKLVMFLLVAAGPFLIAILGLMAYAGFTRPIRILVDATRKMKSGDLDTRITGLKDEFAELGDAFDDMASALQQYTQKIEESEKCYRHLFESAADAIFILSVEKQSAGKIVQANQAAARMHGYTVEELLTMNIGDLDTPDAALSIPGRLDRIRAGEWLRTEITHRRKDGTVFPVEVSAGIVEVGGQQYILALDRDIEERKQAEEAIQRAQQIRVAGEMATGLAHEIKNPLAGIKAAMEMLSHETYFPDEDRAALVKAIAEIKRIEFLMKSLLNFARPPKPHLVRTDVNSVLDTVVGSVLKDPAYARDSGRAITIEKSYYEGLPEVVADPMQLQQIFMNLLLNAADAMPGGGTLSLETRYQSDERIVEITLADTGTGVDASVIHNVFQPFFTTKAKGTGLGLAITKRLVEENEGEISLANRPGGGAMFIIRFHAAPEGDAGI